MSDDIVVRGNPEPYWIRERVTIREFVNDPSIAEFSLAEASVKPGVTTELHHLTVNEWYVIRRGEGLMEVGGTKPFPVGPGDVIPIPAGTSQRITNEGDTDLVFECVCLPRFTPDAYVTVEPD